MFHEDYENQSIYDEEDSDQHADNATSSINKRKRKQYKIKWNQ